MPLKLDYVNHLVLITSPTLQVSGQTLHDFIQDEAVTPVGLLHPDTGLADVNADTEIIYPDGKIEDPGNPGVFSQIILRFNVLWQVQFFGGSGFTRLFGAKFVGGVGGEVIKASGTAGDVTVMESQVDGIVTRSGLTTEQNTKLEELHKLRGLLAGKPATYKPGEITVDGITIKVTGDGELITTLTRQ